MQTSFQWPFPIFAEKSFHQIQNSYSQALAFFNEISSSTGNLLSALTNALVRASKPSPCGIWGYRPTTSIVAT